LSQFSLPPWASRWFSPAAALPRERTGRFSTLAPTAAAGAATALFVAARAFGPATPLAGLPGLAAASAALGALIGIALGYLAGFVLAVMSEALHGQGSAAGARAALARGAVPWSLACILALALQGAGLLAGVPALAAAAAAVLLLGFAWSFFVTLTLLAQSQGFGRGGALGAMLLALCVAAVFGVIGARALVYRPFVAASESMSPTLTLGDYFLVDRLAYGYGRYSFPLLPKDFAGRLFGAQPKRGDVVVFALPRDPSAEWEKRVVGLPGDRIQMIAGRLHVNGEVAARREIANGLGVEGQDGKPAPVYEETLPGGVAHEIAEAAGDQGFLDNTEVFVVPPGQYFVMGDNRDNSVDSRIQTTSGVGFVPYENLIGRVVVIYFSLDEGEVRWSRIGRGVR